MSEELRKLAVSAGFCDPMFYACDKTSDNIIRFEDQPTLKSNLQADDYKKAFNNLASLTGSENLETSDFEALKNPKKLAQVISNDPILKDLCDTTQFKFKKREFSGDGKHCTATTPLHYKRAIFYIQSALKILLGDKASTLTPNGIYDLNLVQAVSKFKNISGIEDKDQDKTLDSQTIKLISIRLKHDKNEIIESLKEIASTMKSYDAFLLKSEIANEKEKANNVIKALVWMGWINTDKPKTADQILTKQYYQSLDMFEYQEGTPNVAVRKHVLKWLIEEIESKQLHSPR